MLARFSCVLAAAVCVSAGPVVPTTSGPVEGKKSSGGFSTFHGVPFARPPTGENRWTKPVDPTTWISPREATSPGAMCPQFDAIRGFMIGSEDCMYLSVYVPSGCSADSPCPVMQVRPPLLALPPAVFPFLRPRPLLFLLLLLFLLFLLFLLPVRRP